MIGTYNDAVERINVAAYSHMGGLPKSNNLLQINKDPNYMKPRSAYSSRARESTSRNNRIVAEDMDGSGSHRGIGKNKN